MGILRSSCPPRLRTRTAKSQGHTSDITRRAHQESLGLNTYEFYDNTVHTFATMETTPVTLHYLLELGKQQSIIESGRYLHEELPKRMARRCKALQNLPFIIGVNPWIRSVHNLYKDSFDTLRAIPEVKDEQSEAYFSRILRALVEDHNDVIPKLAKGFMECEKYMKRKESTDFLDKMINARIGIRVLAEHHLALREYHPAWIGIVNTRLSPASLVRKVADQVQELCEINYGSAPEVELTGHIDTIFAYIPVHLEYVLTELLKNAFRATVEYGQKTRQMDLPPIEVTIGRGLEEISFRVRDQGGGIPEHELNKVWEYSYTTVPKYNESESDALSTISRMNMQRGMGGPMAGLGFGLPMSRIYAQYFGGTMDIKVVEAHGCDAFLMVPNISTLTATLQI
ncbi:hypothetical protein SeMB42_g00405 [Synchytrium endobioticum]|nr:hypothetical protein SeMB42_g00405 [Synchytrium endobioticum]